MVLDPFLGTGTTMQAAIVLGRNSCGYEIDANFESIIRENISAIDIDSCNKFIKQRFDTHIEFVKARMTQGKEVKHYNAVLDVPVMTKQEEEIEFNYLNDISIDAQSGEYSVSYEEHSNMLETPTTIGLFANI